MNIKTPPEITDSAIAAGNAKISATVRRPAAIVVSAMLAGAFIAIGGILSLTIGYGFPEATAGNPALQKLLCGATFPIGLILVVILGAELFTGNNAMLIPGYLRHDYPLSCVIRNWTAVYIGNLIGAVAFTYFFVYLPGLTSSAPYHDAIVGIGIAKTSMSWPIVMLKGIGANWLVCSGIWLALSGHNLIEKAFGCWLPVMAFVALGYEHSIANMFYLPLAMFEGAPISIDTCLTTNILPATIGNILGGAVFVGGLHAYIHRPRQPRQ